MPATLSTLGSYAKVIALTQGTINRGLRDLQLAYPSDLQVLHYADEQLGDIDLDLGAPQLLIKDENNFYFLFNIKFGSLSTKEPKRDISLEGWTIAHKLDKETLLNFPGTIGRDGNLAIERIFSVLVSSASDGFQPDPILSVRSSKQDLQSSTAYTWEDWSKDFPDDCEWTATVFKDLPKKYKAGGASAIGYTIKLPQSPEPKFNRLDLGIEKESRSILDYVKATNSGKANTQAPKLNSILITGQTADSTAAATDFSGVLFTTNLVSQAMTQATTDVQTGLWTLNCHDMLEKLILPKICIMNEASVLKTGPAIWTDHGNGTKQYEPLIQVERNLASTEEDHEPKMGYVFTKANDVNGSPTGFRWDWSMNVPQTQTDNVGNAGKSHRYQTSSSSSATATWSQTELRNHIKCQYTVKYLVDSTWASSLKWEEASDGAQFTFILKYFFYIKFEMLAGGKLKITLVSIPDETKTEKSGGIVVGVINDTTFGAVTPYEIDFYENLETYINDNMCPSIRKASRHLMDWFDRNMVFDLDPELNWMNFITQPQFNTTGDMVMGIQYKAPSHISGFLTPYVAPQKTSGKDKEETQKVETKPATKLVWTYSFIQDPEDEDSGILQLVGKNTSQLPMSIGYFIVTVSSGSGPGITTPGVGGETEVIPLLFSAKTIKSSVVELVNPPGEPEVEARQSSTDKKLWDIRIPPIPQKDQAPELAVFKVRGEETVEIKIQAKCNTKTWKAGTKGAVLGAFTIKEYWKDPENAKMYIGDGEVVVKVTLKL